MNNSIREESWAFVEARGLPRNNQLPSFDATIVKTTGEEVASRILCMNATAAVAFGLPPEVANAWLKKHELARALSSFETSYLQGDVRHQFAMQNQIYSMQALSWCGGLFDDEFLLKDLPNDFVRVFPDLMSLEPPTSFCSRLRLRPINAIIPIADKTYCLHWALRDAQMRLKRIPLLRWLPAIEAQRHSLEWVVNGGAWEGISLDT